MVRKIHEVMTRGVEVVQPSDTVRAAAEMMRDLSVGPLPVCNGARVVGMVTDRDIVVRAVAQGLDPSTARVADVMSPGIEYCFDDEETDAVLRRMEERQVRRFVVVDRNKKLVGIVALGDLSSSEDRQRVGETLQGISEGPSTPV
ncbi:CBS domain-containing protein [Melittangium boletus]|uniref:Inosine-5-monophosphate dehydrogenase n=1 Tax=Melittangium boletus DSM 14713 TaxID=1294270 RepID=A0A250IF10_9BACT|nr:CBS domain-containing protein [Melittangium boletus]ATB29823.1 inosine-5-monophosphate dehydrogenase [Melittangium boletus DSM 14713]